MNLYDRISIKAKSLLKHQSDQKYTFKMVHLRVRTTSENKNHKETDTFISKKQQINTDSDVVGYDVIELGHLTDDVEVKKKLVALLNSDAAYPCVYDDDGCMDPDCKLEGKEVEDDPWDIPSFRDDTIRWNELSLCGRVRRVCVDWVGKGLGLLALLYLFICSLDLLSSAFRLLGGKTAGSAFSSDSLLQNPVCGLMVGIMATVLLQSSSTSTSIVITMVASGILSVEHAIYIIMGANIGTSVTNTVVSMAQSGDRNQFRRAFAGATVHDMFNWLSVAVLLPLEYCTGYLYRLTSLLVKSIGFEQNSGSKCDFLKRLTKPLTENIIQLDKSVITAIALGKEEYFEKTLIKKWCSYDTQIIEQNVTLAQNMTLGTVVNVSAEQNVTVQIPTEECWFLFHDTGMRDSVIGVLLLAVSLALLCTCLVAMVKLLNSVLKGQIAKVVKKTVNAELPGKFKYFTGYLAMLLGAGMTVLVQSSSVFTSAMTPLVGLGVIRLERMYPLTLGSNIGTTGTGLLAAMAASGDKLEHSVQIALVHLFFNISGILLFYPVPCMRFPIGLAKMMGNTTAKYRWFAALYLIVMFILVPASIFALSMAGTIVFSVVLSILTAILVFAVTLNILQRKIKSRLPKVMQTWDFLPFKWMHSLEPLDQLITKSLGVLKPVFRPCIGSSVNGNNDLAEIVVEKELQAINGRHKDSLFDSDDEADNEANNDSAKNSIMKEESQLNNNNRENGSKSSSLFDDAEIKTEDKAVIASPDQNSSEIEIEIKEESSPAEVHNNLPLEIQESSAESDVNRCECLNAEENEELSDERRVKCVCGGRISSVDTVKQQNNASRLNSNAHTKRDKSVQDLEKNKDLNITKHSALPPGSAQSDQCLVNSGDILLRKTSASGDNTNFSQEIPSDISSVR